MSFGKRSTPPSKMPSQRGNTQQKPLNTSDFRPEIETKTDDDGKYSIILTVLTTVTIVLGLGVVLQLSDFNFSPIPYKTTSVSYSIGDRVLAFSLPSKSAREQDYLEKKRGIDFSLILTPASEETTPAMKRVAEECLPRRNYKRRVLPFYTGTTFEQATSYLNCAMSFNMDRLCLSQERKRLVQQLSQYLDVRQSVWGAKKAVISFHQEHHKIDNLKTSYEVLANTANIRKLALERASMFGMSTLSNRRRASRSRQSYYRESENYLSLREREIDNIIDDKMDAGIANHLKILVQRGYLSTKDFGWYGLILPAEYSPYLQEKMRGKDQCAGNRT